jgi:hypothetical protein
MSSSIRCHAVGWIDREVVEVPLLSGGCGPLPAGPVTFTLFGVAPLSFRP